ncbi:hypothetical protein HDU80_003249, partial [Chytriomyces hyalinus]
MSAGEIYLQAEADLWTLVKGKLICSLCGNKKINSGAGGNPCSLGIKKRSLACSGSKCSKPRLVEYILSLPNTDANAEFIERATAVHQLYLSLKSGRKTPHKKQATAAIISAKAPISDYFPPVNPSIKPNAAGDANSTNETSAA